MYAQMLMHMIAHGGVGVGGECRHCKRVCTESCLWEKNPLLHWGIEPASAACRSNALPTELHPCSASNTLQILLFQEKERKKATR